MSDIEVLALTLVALWLLAVTVAVLALVRQIGLVTVRLEYRPSPAPDGGPMIGSRVPAAAREVVPELELGRVAILFLSPTCAPCAQIAPELGSFRQQVIAAVPGTDEAAAEFARLIPAQMRVIRDPDATKLGHAFEVQGAPFLVAAEAGIVSGKAYLSTVEDLGRFFEKYDESNVSEIVATSREAASNVA